MQRVCFTLRVRPDKLDEYKKVHEDVWPEMKDALTRHGWHNYSLFLRPDGQLIGYCETPDFDAAVKGMQTEPINEKWQASVGHLFEELAAGAADTSMRPIEEVFHLD